MKRAKTQTGVSALWLVALLHGCVGSVSEGGGEPPVSATGELDLDRFFRGQALYDQNCAPCHGVFEESVKQGRPVEAISAALAGIPLMRAFEASLSDLERGDIAYALAQDPLAIPCPPIGETQRAVPVPGVQLAADLARKLALPQPSVAAALSNYRLGYDASDEFDNQDRAQLISGDTVSSLMEAMTALATLWVAADPARVACADSECAVREFTGAAISLGLSSATHVESASGIFSEAVSGGLEPQEGLRMGVVRLLMAPEVVFTQLDFTSSGGADSAGSSISPTHRLVAALASRSPSAEEMELEFDELFDQLMTSSGPTTLAERFAMRWLGVSQKAEELQQGDVSLLPISPELIRDLNEQSRLDFREWMLRDLPLSDLMASDVSHLNERVATYYNVPGVTGDEFRSVDVSGTRGGGLLTQGAIHLSAGGSNETSPVVRGHWVLRNLLCLTLPPAPPVEEVVAALNAQAETEQHTARERSAARRASPMCEGCHHVMDEIGFALEGFDAWGAARTRYENGDPVETYGQLPGDVNFEGAHDLANHLSESLTFRMCATRKLTQYLAGRELSQPEMCRIRQLAARLPTDIPAREWVRTIAESDVFQRTTPARAPEPRP